METAVTQAERIRRATKVILELLEEANKNMEQAAEHAKDTREEILDPDSPGTELGAEVLWALEALIEDIEGTSASAFEWERFMCDARNLAAIAAAGVERTRAEVLN